MTTTEHYSLSFSLYPSSYRRGDVLGSFPPLSRTVRPSETSLQTPPGSSRTRILFSLSTSDTRVSSGLDVVSGRRPQVRTMVKEETARRWAWRSESGPDGRSRKLPRVGTSTSIRSPPSHVHGRHWNHVETLVCTGLKSPYRMFPRTCLTLVEFDRRRSPRDKGSTRVSPHTLGPVSPDRRSTATTCSRVSVGPPALDNFNKPT